MVVDVDLESCSCVETADVNEVVEEREDERERVRDGVSGACGGGFMRSGRVVVPVDLKVYGENDMMGML